MHATVNCLHSKLYRGPMNLFHILPAKTSLWSTGYADWFCHIIVVVIIIISSSSSIVPDTDISVYLCCIICLSFFVFFWHVNYCDRWSCSVGVCLFICVSVCRAGPRKTPSRSSIHSAMFAPPARMTDGAKMAHWIEVRLGDCRRPRKHCSRLGSLPHGEGEASMQPSPNYFVWGSASIVAYLCVCKPGCRKS